MTSSPLLNALCSVILSTHCNVILRCAGDYLLNLKQTCTREQELVGSQVKTWFSHIKAKFYFFIKMFYLFIFFNQCKPKSSVSRCELHHVKKNCSTFQTITKALIHNSAVKFYQPSRQNAHCKYYTREKKCLCVCVTFGRRDNLWPSYVHNYNIQH